MKIFLCFAALLLYSCSTESDSNGIKYTQRTFGWRSAGLMPENGNEFAFRIDIASFGEYIFVKNVKTIPDLVADVFLPYRDTHSKYIFFSKQGSMHWDTLKMPENFIPSAIYADSGGLYVGTRKTGQLWNYNPYTKIWADLKVPKQKESLNIYAITRLGGKLVLSTSDYDYGMGNTVNEIAIVLMQKDGEAWEDITPPRELTSVPIVFKSSREWRGSLFITTSSRGFWRFNPAYKEWSLIPPVTASGPSGKCGYPEVTEIFEDRLYAGYSDGCGIFTLNDNFSDWTSVDSTRESHYVQYEKYGKWTLVDTINTNGHNFGYNTITTHGDHYDCRSVYEKNIPSYVEAFATNGRDLFVSGYGDLIFPSYGRAGPPLIYTGGSRGEPKGWRRVHYKGGWRLPDSSYKIRSFGLQTVGLGIVGDTLYAANRKGLYKFPLSDLGRGLENEYPYPYYSYEDISGLPSDYISAWDLPPEGEGGMIRLD